MRNQVCERRKYLENISKLSDKEENTLKILVNLVINTE